MKKRVEDTRLVTLGNAKAYPVTTSATLRGVKPPVMLVAEVLPAGMLCGLTSYPGVGKTWFAIELTRAVVTGDKFLGEYPVLGGPQGVLVVGSDSSEADYARQWTRLTAAEYQAWLDATDAAHEAGNEPPTNPFDKVKFLIQSTFMLDNVDEVRRLIRTVSDETLFPRTRTSRKVVDDEGEHVDTIVEESGGCALIVFDTLSRLTIANQNDNTEMERVFANIRTICEVTGAAVLLLHHNSKPTEYNDGGDWRGAMSQIGALDSWVNLSAHKSTKRLVRADFKKFRGITPSAFEYKMGVDDEATAKLTFVGRTDGFFGQDDLKAEMERQFTDWRTVGAVEEVLWPAWQDKFPERLKFKKALKNRMGDLFPEKLERRGQQRTYEYKVKGTCESDSSAPVNSAPLVEPVGSIPTR
jgi:hypothetical protein